MEIMLKLRFCFSFSFEDTKDHKPAAFIMSKRRDDQMQDLFSNLEPDDDLSL